MSSAPVHFIQTTINGSKRPALLRLLVAPCCGNHLFCKRSCTTGDSVHLPLPPSDQKKYRILTTCSHIFPLRVRERKKTKSKYALNIAEPCQFCQDLPSSLVPQPSLWPLKATISNRSCDTQSKFTNKKQLVRKYSSKKEGRTMQHVTACPLVLDHQLLQIQLLATRELLELCQKPLVFPGKNQLSLSLSLSPGPPHERA